MTVDELTALAENVVKSTAAKIRDEHRENEIARNETVTAVAKELIELRSERAILKQALASMTDRVARIERQFGKSTQAPDLGARVDKQRDPKRDVLDAITVRQ
jgi:hypothetical protein